MEQFVAERLKANFDAIFVEIDLVDWLEMETIQSVVFSALDSGGGDATSEVLDLGRSGFTGTKVFPYIKGGVDGETYTVLSRVNTLEGSYQEYRVKFRVREAP